MRVLSVGDDAREGQWVRRFKRGSEDVEDGARAGVDTSFVISVVLLFSRAESVVVDVSFASNWIKGS